MTLIIIIRGPIVVISIRLVFLVVEFSGGFILENLFNKISLGKSTKQQINAKNINNASVSQGNTTKIKTPLLLESTKSTKFYSNDDYFMISTRRKARSEYA